MIPEAKLHSYLNLDLVSPPTAHASDIDTNLEYPFMQTTLLSLAQVPVVYDIQFGSGNNTIATSSTVTVRYIPSLIVVAYQIASSARSPSLQSLVNTLQHPYSIAIDAHNGFWRFQLDMLASSHPIMLRCGRCYQRRVHHGH